MVSFAVLLGWFGYAGFVILVVVLLLMNTDVAVGLICDWCVVVALGWFCDFGWWGVLWFWGLWVVVLCLVILFVLGLRWGMVGCWFWC